MKIVHTHNIGVVNTLVDWQRMHGHDSMTVGRAFTEARKLLTFGYDFVEKNTWPELRDWLWDNAMDADIVHVHTARRPGVQLWNKWKFNGILIFTAHGTKTREIGYDGVRGWADGITCVTPDLLEPRLNPEGVELIPNAPDPSIFNRREDPIPGTALGMIWDKFPEKSPIDEWKEFCDERGLQLRLLRRNQDLMPRIKFARYLELFEYYFDDKIGETDGQRRDFSMTAMEFLQLGQNKVVKSGKVYSRLPRRLRYEVVMKQYDDFYKKIYDSVNSTDGDQTAVEDIACAEHS